MATKPLTLSGLVEPTAKAADEGMLREWRREKQHLEEEILSLRRELDDARIQNEKLERSLRALRKQLSLLHLALRAVFGEIELAVGEKDFSQASPSSPVQASAPNNSDPRWESYKQTFPGNGAKVIDILLAHPILTTVQLSKIGRMHYDTAKKVVQTLAGAGAVIRDAKGVRLNR